MEKHKIPFQISGGLAAKIYGSPRKLADIDIDIPKYKFIDIIAEVKDYIVWGPKRYKDKNWDVFMMTLKYANQKIDISGGPVESIFDEKKRCWVNDRINFSNRDVKKIFGMFVPIITKRELIDYKKKIARNLDKIDIEAIKVKK